MGNIPLLHQEILGACIKAASLQYSCGFGNLPGRKRGNLEEPDPPLHDDPPRGRLFRSLGVRVWVVTDPQGMLPSMSEWMTSTNCASPGSNLSSGGLPLNKGPAGSRPGRKTESAWQPHAMSHLQPGFGSHAHGDGSQAAGHPRVGRHSHSHPAVSGSFPQPCIAVSHTKGGYPHSAP